MRAGAVDTRARSIAKTVSWRIVATGTTVALVFVFTGELAISLGVGVLEAASKLALYYLHERGWARVRWGKPGRLYDRLDERRAQRTQ